MLGVFRNNCPIFSVKLFIKFHTNSILIFFSPNQTKFPNTPTKIRIKILTDMKPKEFPKIVTNQSKLHCTLNNETFETLPITSIKTQS